MIDFVWEKCFNRVAGLSSMAGHWPRSPRMECTSSILKLVSIHQVQFGIEMTSEVARSLQPISRAANFWYV